jgi:L,D-peptidoglycan transpeptidase YkuD (ErfK/YbiS/YcfS/YnhG family)
MHPRRLLAGALFASALLAVGLAVPASAEPVFHPSRLAGIGDAQQVVVVTAPAWRSTTGTLRAYERGPGQDWRLVVDATPAFLGYGGLAPESSRRQGTGTTPVGTFDILRGFGRATDPGTALPYRRVDRDDAWTYNPAVPATYNLFQDAPVSWRSYGRYVEMLWSYGRQYDYVAVLDYNLPDGSVTRTARGVRRTSEPADTRAGGGIFLHVSKGGPTAGCIAIARPRMRSVMQWLDPAKNPVLVVGPTSEIAAR